MSISAIFPPRTVKPMTENGFPSSMQSSPATPFDEHWEPEQPEAREALRATSHLLRAADLDRSACQHPTGVDSEDYLRVEDSNESVEVTSPAAATNVIDDSSFNFHVGIRSGLPLPNGGSGTLARWSVQTGWIWNRRGSLVYHR